MATKMKAKKDVKAPKMPNRFQVFRGGDGDWWWRFISRGNGKIRFGSLEGFKRQHYAVMSCDWLIDQGVRADIEIIPDELPDEKEPGGNEPEVLPRPVDAPVVKITSKSDPVGPATA